MMARCIFCNQIHPTSLHLVSVIAQIFYSRPRSTTGLYQILGVEMLPPMPICVVLISGTEPLLVVAETNLSRSRTSVVRPSHVREGVGRFFVVKVWTFAHSNISPPQ